MADQVKTESFDTFLVEHGFITQALYENLKQQSASQGKSIVDIITEQQILNGETLAQAKAAFLNIPYVSFADKKVELDIIGTLPEETYRFYKFFAF